MAGLGISLLVAAVAVIVVLHLIGPGAAISPVHLTISEYGLTSVGWIFSGAVLLAAAGVCAVLAAALARWRGRSLSPAAAVATVVCGAVAVAGLVTVAVVHKTDWTIGPTIGGTVHRVASLVAFVALPLALIVLAAGAPRTTRRGRPGRCGWPARRGWPARCTLVLAIVGPLWLVPILYALATAAPGAAWWLAVPLGAIERAMVATEFLAVISLAIAVRQAASAQPAVGEGSAQRPRGATR